MCQSWSESITHQCPLEDRLWTQFCSAGLALVMGAKLELLRGCSSGNAETVGNLLVVVVSISGINASQGSTLTLVCLSVCHSG